MVTPVSPKTKTPDRGDRAREEISSSTQYLHSCEKQQVSILHFTGRRLYAAALLRRVALRNVGSLEAYCAQLEKDPGELNALYRDLLISVTRFFRDPESFENLKKLVFPRLFQDRPVDAPIRVWVPGCSTGERGLLNCHMSEGLL